VGVNGIVGVEGAVREGELGGPTADGEGIPVIPWGGGLLCNKAKKVEHKVHYLAGLGAWVRLQEGQHVSVSPVHVWHLLRAYRLPSWESFLLLSERRPATHSAEDS